MYNKTKAWQKLFSWVILELFWRAGTFDKKGVSHVNSCNQNRWLWHANTKNHLRNSHLNVQKNKLHFCALLKGFYNIKNYYIFFFAWALRPLSIRPLYLPTNCIQWRSRRSSESMWNIVNGKTRKLASGGISATSAKVKCSCTFPLQPLCIYISSQHRSNFSAYCSHFFSLNYIAHTNAIKGNLLQPSMKTYSWRISCTLNYRYLRINSWHSGCNVVSS